MKRKGVALVALVGVMVISGSFTSLAGWEQVEGAWKYSENGAYLTGWQWIDGNNDGVAECYYLGADGIVSANTLVEGYTINSDGQWTVDGVVQTQVKENLSTEEIAGIDRSIGKGFIKQEFIDCLGRSKAYVNSIYGEPISEMAEEYMLSYDLESIYITPSGQRLYVGYKDGIVKEISGYNELICNFTKDNYSVEEINEILGIEGGEYFGDFIWGLQENPLIMFQMSSLSISRISLYN